MPPIYMDNNATTPVLPEVVAAMQPYWSQRFGNASAVHTHGRTAREAIDHAREQVANLIGARATEITFTAGGTESDNHALFGILTSGRHLITSSIEHHAVLHAAQELERRGVALTVVDPDQNGVVPVEAIQNAIRPETALISIMLANNETGVLQPVREIAAFMRERNILTHRENGILLHTDAVQCGGKLPIDVGGLGCDLLSLSAHKMHAPQGVGALWTRRGLQLKPLLYGGPHERQRRAGTENVPGIVAFGEASALAHAWLNASANTTRCFPNKPGRAPSPPGDMVSESQNGSGSLNELRNHLESELLRRVPGTVIHGGNVPRLPNTTSVRFEGIDAEALVIALDLKGLSLSGGSACTSGAVEPSHVLRAMGLTDAEARSTIRISLSRLTTEAETAQALDLLANTVAHLRTLS